MNIYNETIEDIKQQCSCAITVGLDYDTKLRCVSSDEKVIIFETKAYASNDTITLLEQSIPNLLYNRSSNIIIINGNTLTPTDSFCLERTASNITCVDMFFPPNDTSSDHNNKSDDDRTGTMVGIIIAALFIIILAISAAVILMVVYCKKRHSYK